MDTPDENAHYARALYLSDGHLYVPEKLEQSKIADDIIDVEAVFKQPLALSNLEDEEVAEEEEEEESVEEAFVRDIYEKVVTKKRFYNDKTKTFARHSKKNCSEHAFQQIRQML